MVLVEELTYFWHELRRFSNHFLHFPFSKCTLGVCIEQSLASQHQISETKQRKQQDGIFNQPFVARLVITKQVLHHMEWMLNLGECWLGPVQYSPVVHPPLFWAMPYVFLVVCDMSCTWLLCQWRYEWVPGWVSTATCAFMLKCHWLSLLVWNISLSRLLFYFWLMVP